MQEIHGTSGKIALVDLSGGTMETREVPPLWRRDYLGGKGLALKFFYELRQECLETMDPLGDENLLCFFSGVMSGTGAVCSARFSGLTLSPLTGLMVHASCGGPFGIALKTAGYDGLIITGKAESPTILELDATGGSNAESPGFVLKPADALWGLDCEESLKLLDLQKGDGSLLIGPAGENQVRYANIASGHRYLGRGGMGAVMGSKQLKAVVAHGGAWKVLPANRSSFDKTKKRSVSYINRNSFALSYRKFGTAFNVRPGIKAGYLPVRNFDGRTDPRAEALSGEVMAERYKSKPSPCKPCTIICGHKGTFPDGEVRQLPEYETVGLLGPNLDIYDPDLVGRWNQAANRFGMDTITLGATLSWAMEAASKGIRPSSLAFGQADGIEEMIEAIALKKGEGAELAEGTRRLAEKYGGEEFAVHVKGLELAAYDPRAAWGQGLNYAVANRGGCHLNAFPIGLEVLFGFLNPRSKRAKAKWVDYFEDVYSAVNSLQTCQFSAFAYVLEPFVAKYTPRPLLNIAMTWLPKLSRLGLDWSVYSNYYQSITGIPTTAARLRRCGRRVHILERYMNTLRGVSVQQDRLPGRFTGKDDVPVGSMVQAYYRQKGYDRRGIPLPAVLRRYGIAADAAGRLHRLAPLRRRFARGYCGFLLWFLGKAAAAASRHDEEIAEEFRKLPEGFTFALQVTADGPAMVLGRDSGGRGVYYGGSAYLLDNPVDLVLRIKTLSGAMLLFTFRESTVTSQAHDRLAVDGPVPQACAVVRILNRLECIILPRFIARRAVRRYRKPVKLAAKRLAVYMGALKI
jgi:aldehyde:ferredoxin oxidoreductase